MNLRIGKIRRYNNKILIASPSFKIGTNLKINLDGERAKIKDKPDVKFNKKQKQDIKPNTGFSKEHKQDIKPNTGSKREHKSTIEFNKEHKQDVKMIRTEPDTNKITYEAEKEALVLVITTIFTVWWMFK